MKQKILFGLIVISFFSCSPTQVVNRWRDPGITSVNPNVHKIVVAALIYNQGIRRSVEDYMASLYPGTATQSYLVLGNDSLITNQAASDQMLKSQGYDGIVIMKQVDENTSHYYVPGTAPSYYSTWGGYWGNRWGTSFFTPGTPGYYGTNRTWTVEVNVYSLDPNKIIWSATTKTTNPGGTVPLFHDVCDAVVKQMKKDGFLL